MASFKWPPDGGAGTVISVGLADGSTIPIYDITNSPVAGTGTLTFTLKTELANLLLAGPATGPAAQPTFRALVAADLPSGAVLSMGAFGSTPNNNGGSIAAQVLTLQPADATHPGGVSTTTQSFLGQKTFLTGLTGTLTGSASLNVLTSALGNLTDAGTDGIVVTGGTGSVVGSVSLAQHVADSTHNGYLASTDWVIFNAKQAAITIGNLTDAGTDGIVITGGTGSIIGSGVSIAQHVADTTHNGYLSSTDWNTFNGKGSVSSVAMTVPTFLSVSGSPITTSGTLAVTLSGTALPIANGGTAVTAVTTAPAATAFAGWDAYYNLSSNNFIEGYKTTATAAGTTALLVSDAYLQYFTGTTTQTVTMPVVSGLVTGMQYVIVNLSTGIVTVQSSGGNTIQAMASNTQLVLTCISTSGTGVASWNASYQASNFTAPINPTVQKFTSSSGTYTTPAGVQFIRVRMVGGGGGGAGSGTAAGTAAGTGGNTTFGSSLLVANGGTGGAFGAGGGTGGTASLGSGPIGTAISGGNGNGSGGTSATGVSYVGGIGASTPFAGGGAGGGSAIAGVAGLANSGTGGGGAGIGGGANNNSGAGGGAGGFVDAIISSPIATYSYAVGAVGSAGGAGSGGLAGGAGGSGYIEVTEYYSNLGISATSSVAARTFFQGPATGTANPTFGALLPPVVTTKTATGTTTGWWFQISTTTTCAVGDTYTNNGNTYTVLAALTAQTGYVLFMSGASTPTAPGTPLVRATGSGTSSISYTGAVPLATYTASTSPAPLFLKVRVVGGGGGGGGSGNGSASNNGNPGTASAFGSAVLIANGGGAGLWANPPNAGGSVTVNSPAVALAAFQGTSGGGDSGVTTIATAGGNGGSSPFGGGGYGSFNIGGGGAIANSGSGGGGGGTSNGVASSYTGSGGSSGGYIEVQINSPSTTYVYSIGSGGNGGTAGTGGFTGGNGAAGYLLIEEYFQ